MDKIGDSLQIVTRQINGIFGNREPWQIATITATTVLTTVWIWEFLNHDESEFVVAAGPPYFGLQ